MRLLIVRRLAVGAALAFCFAPLLAAAPMALVKPEAPARGIPSLALRASLAPIRSQQYTGKVVPLADLVGKIGSKLDADAAPHWLALVTADGKIYPLIKDGGSRMFFKDKALLHRPMRLTGRLLPGSQLLQVLEVNSLRGGVPHEVYYWCDICSIRRSEKGQCECCGGPMELREEPLKK